MAASMTALAVQAGVAASGYGLLAFPHTQLGGLSSTCGAEFGGQGSSTLQVMSCLCSKALPAYPPKMFLLHHFSMTPGHASVPEHCWSVGYALFKLTRG